MESNFRHPAEQIRRDVEALLQKSGILFRTFGRGKSHQSIIRKIENSPGKYSANGRLIQDAIGIRVALYFFEDTSIVENLLKSRYAIDKNASTVDRLKSDQFTVSRHNLVFHAPAEIAREMQLAILNLPIDLTFEVQLRSILSEGWHEVDHDLRYKCKENWNAQSDLDRALNGILATLETSEWSMKKIFDDLAYRHYKSGNWGAMLHSKFRMRTTPDLSNELKELLNQDINLAKEILRVDRAKIIQAFSNATPRVPVNLDNILLIANSIGPHNEIMLDKTPNIVLDAIKTSIH
jgi:ppGpp synthetase/RelA/SpoT-type nucleotidyltranferase